MYCSVVDRPSRSRVRRAPRNATVLPSSSISLSMYDGLDRVQSVHPIHLDGTSAVWLGLRNNYDRRWVAYKVKTSRNRSIRISPARGIIGPEEETKVKLEYARAGMDGQDESGLIVVVSAVIVEDGETDPVEAWRTAERTGAPAWKKTLRVVVETDREERG